MRRDFNAFSYSYFRTGSQQVAASLQDSSLAVMLRRFDKGINAQSRDVYENHPEYQFCSDIYMAYRDSHIEEYRFKRDEILNEVTEAAVESSKISQHALQELDENFDVIGLINFNWGHAMNKPLNVGDRHLRERRIPQSKSTIIKNKYAIRYLAGQERMCRLSGMAQRITPHFLNLRSIRQSAGMPMPLGAGFAKILQAAQIDRRSGQGC